MMPHHFKMVEILVSAASATGTLMAVMVTATCLLVPVAATGLVAATTGRRTAAGRSATTASRRATTGRRTTTGRGSTTSRRGARGCRAAGAIGDVRGRRHRDGALCQTIDRGRRCHRRCRADIGRAADRDVVGRDVHGVGGKALAGSYEHRLVRRQRRAGVAVQDAGEPLDRGGAIGLQRAVVQFVVEAALEDRTLRSVESGAEILVVLDLHD